MEALSEKIDSLAPQIDSQGSAIILDAYNVVMGKTEQQWGKTS